MKRLMTFGLAPLTALAIAACGGGGGSPQASSGPGSNAPSQTVSVEQLSGVGTVLVDHADDKALYTPNLEASGKIVCTGTCNAFWKPLTVSGGKPTASASAGKLGVIARSDGSRQVTDNGKPLYTFSEDTPGKATGNGFTDDFGAHHFTWHVVRPAGAATGAAGSSSGSAATTASPGSNGGGY
jgi:predicted lipoprotein with Yx(FWY)xxD motif